MTDNATDRFDCYIKSIVSDEWNSPRVDIFHGETAFGKKFAFVLTIRYWRSPINVFQIWEPESDSDNNYVLPYPPVSFQSFPYRQLTEAMNYIVATINDSRSKLIYPQFDKYVDEKLKTISGFELYRIRDVDEHGNMFALALIKRFCLYKVVQIMEPPKDASGRYLEQDSVVILMFIKHLPAECYIQKRRNELKGLQKIIRDNEDKYLEDTPSRDYKFGGKSPDSESEHVEDVFDPKRKEAFDAFVEKSVAISFRGDKVYTEYGITAAGQYFAMALSKINYYIVRVVLEPDERYGNDLDSLIDWYSRTFHLINIKKRVMINNWMSEAKTELVKKDCTRFAKWASEVHSVKISLNLLETQEVVLKRGDHIRRNLKIGMFNPTYHDGIYLGEGKVGHYTTSSEATFLKSKGGSGAGIVTLEEFLKGEDKLYLVLCRSPLRSGEGIAGIAEQLINNKVWDKKYNLAHKNCQLFVSFCAYGNSEPIASETKCRPNCCTKLCVALCLLGYTIAFIPMLITGSTDYMIPLVVISFLIAMVLCLFYYRRSKSRKEAYSTFWGWNAEAVTNSDSTLSSSDYSIDAAAGKLCYCCYKSQSRLNRSSVSIEVADKPTTTLL